MHRFNLGACAAALTASSAHSMWQQDHYKPDCILGAMGAVTWRVSAVTSWNNWQQQQKQQKLELTSGKQ